MIHDPPVSDTDMTEIYDTDFDSDSYDYSENSGHMSVGSLGTESVTTASTPDDIKTPDSTGLTGFHFQIDENPVKGPMGPHLFRVSSDYTQTSYGLELATEEVPISASTPLYYSASKLEPLRRDTPVPNSDSTQAPTQASTVPQTESRRPSVGALSVSDWSPRDVVSWLQSLEFDESVIEKFFINDITGSILLELQAEDLKELDIQSFGKRHRLMSCIRKLRSTPSSSTCGSQSELDPTSREATSTPNTTAADVGVDCTTPNSEHDKTHSKSSQHRRRRRNKSRSGNDVVPEDSVSIVAIEQLLPRLHTCSKGENCRKFQKQQVKLTRMAKDIPIECLGGSVLITGDPGNPATAQNLAKTPKSDITPSLIASSDALGHNQTSGVELSPAKLDGVQPRDPQENVRNFLNFQRLSKLQPATDPATPPIEHLSPCASSPGSTRGNATLSENLRHLPKLRIPSTHTEVSSVLSPNYSAQRTITPSVLRKHHPFAQQSAMKSPKANGVAESPADFYRIDPHYGQSTPLSEVDVPVTAIPAGPITRACSQSVPPDMRFGGHVYNAPNAVPWPASTKPESSRRNGYLAPGHHGQKTGRLQQRIMLPPIETPEDMEKTPRAAHCKGPFTTNGPNGVSHSGWMKKRKTNRFLRHDWEDHHFTLRGTQLAMYSDEDASRRDSKALEYIDVDDYAVACSSLASSSKLTAAFKKTVLKRQDTAQGTSAFAFSLIPSPTNTTFDKKALFMNGPKAHHFAVKTRDERIDWMRELMLAKALRNGRANATSVTHNGNFI
ncbi:putative SAM and PH domain protein [Aspergillus indologenus CBS 114.80]|uniref:Putative SAM and PH domain protein n=1 Tax=Aspergillus indologenus CBS 114.80 TaxID=1450541 RepID=A0A2V5I8E7_9EURO|nr:putative SAM and PH domain protein [Aspergillus indologenus CBS 114.80]